MNDIKAPLRGQMHRFIPGIAWFFVILVLICLPGEDFTKSKQLVHPNLWR
jgi:hypothetical protein